MTEHTAPPTTRSESTPPAVFAGVDLGSTAMKVLVVDGEGRELVSEQAPTPWRHGEAGITELRPEDLVDAVRSLLDRASRGLAAVTDARVAALAVAGMGESGVLIDEENAPVTSAYAWFDPRGAEQVRSFPDALRSEFAGRTGLPLGAQVSVAKIAHIRDSGFSLSGLRWLNLPEYLVAALGGDVALEHSLTSRTGLLDQDRGAPWPAMLAELGVDETFLPPLRDAGAPWGRISAPLPDNFTGSALTVAGHDHLVAAEASGELSADRYYVSLGTAEVLLRVLDAPLGYDARARLASHLINEVRHVVPGKHVLVAGVKTGLLLRRALQLTGVHDRLGRDCLDDALMELPFAGRLAPGGIEISGARNDDGVLGISVRTDGVTPAELFGAVLRHSNAEIETLVRAMDRELPPATASTLTGGWAGMASVQRARSHVLPELSVSSREQETAYGAARVAQRLHAPASPPPAPTHQTQSPHHQGEPR